MKQQEMIKHFTYYFRSMVKFHDLKVQGVPQVLFILLLAVSFGFGLILQPIVFELSISLQQFINANAELLSEPHQMDQLMQFVLSEEIIRFTESMLKALGIVALQQILLMLLSFFYMGAYWSDLEEEKVSSKLYVRRFLKALPRYIGFQILFYIGVGSLFLAYIFIASWFMMILPVMTFLIFLLPLGWFVIEAIFIFKEITLLDTGVGVLKNFTLSWKLSAGNRLMIGRNIIFIVFLSYAVRMLTAGSNLLLSLFIISFLEVIVLLFRQRLIALMYRTRTRKERKKIDED